MAESDETERPESAQPEAEGPQEVEGSATEADIAEAEPEPEPEQSQLTEDEPAVPLDMKPQEVEWEGIPIPMLLDRIKTEMGHLAVELIVAKLKADLEHDAKGGVMNVVDLLASRVAALESVTEDGEGAIKPKATAARPAKSSKHKNRKGKK